jgi:hypothetical protein
VARIRGWNGWLVAKIGGTILMCRDGDWRDKSGWVGGG